MSTCAVSSLTLGLEEEVFITTPTRPTLDALYALAKLLWRNPRDYYKHTASNFARGRDARQCLMSSVEITTRPHTDIDALLDELRTHRAALADAAGDAYIVPVGHLFDLDAPTNTAGLHIHVGVPAERRQTVYANLAYFLPLLILLSASSPYAGGRSFGQSYRVASSFAIGVLRDDPYYRFQDLILSRRLGTIEIRACDPIWDLARLRVLLEAVQAIAQLPTACPIDRARYAALRHQAARIGYTPDLQALHRELSTVYAIPEALLKTTIADELRGCVQAFQPSPPVSPAYGRVGLWSAEAKLPPNAEAALQHSKRLPATPLSHCVGEGLGVRVKKTDISQQALLHLYARLDHAYRTGRWEPVAPHAVRPSAWRGVLGLLGYYLPRLPYTAYKAWAEWRAPIRDGYLLTETAAGDPTVCRADS
ncbi:glutamate-cysteine ligase family protein [Synechococcus sp. RC10B2]|uniref:glutamate-cysteine ligase family protein n=1 Tax=Synechococcus sp. RC10B2 TaxID=2964530 RepID=UPI0039C6E842